jgi:LytS/YehU family sensor histidine kinase
MQLHPHFLFNTLHSISSLQLEDVGAAQKMTARLGDFLRLTLENAGVQEVSLRREIEFLKCYLDIEQVRFGRRLTTVIEIEPEALEMRVPNLILQPLVENAIRHGITPNPAPGMISIIAKRERDRIKVVICDNGGGRLRARAKRRTWRQLTSKRRSDPKRNRPMASRWPTSKEYLCAGDLFPHQRRRNVEPG